MESEVIGLLNPLELENILNEAEEFVGIKPDNVESVMEDDDNDEMELEEDAQDNSKNHESNSVIADSNSNANKTQINKKGFYEDLKEEIDLTNEIDNSTEPAALNKISSIQEDKNSNNKVDTVPSSAVIKSTANEIVDENAVKTSEEYNVYISFTFAKSPLISRNNKCGVCLKLFQPLECVFAIGKTPPLSLIWNHVNCMTQLHLLNIYDILGKAKKSLESIIGLNFII